MESPGSVAAAPAAAAARKRRCPDAAARTVGWALAQANARLGLACLAHGRLGADSWLIEEPAVREWLVSRVAGFLAECTIAAALGTPLPQPLSHNPTTPPLSPRGCDQAPGCPATRQRSQHTATPCLPCGQRSPKAANRRG